MLFSFVDKNQNLFQLNHFLNFLSCTSDYYSFFLSLSQILDLIKNMIMKF